VDERRTGFLLCAILIAQLIAVAMQGARAPGSTSLAKSTALRAIGPMARAVAAGGEGVSSLRDDVRLQGSLRADNTHLREQVESLKLRLLRLSSVEEELQRLAQAVRYATPLMGDLRAVDVVYADHSPWMRSLILYCGNQPAKVDEPVLSPAGLVGRVVTVAGAYAKVQLITDRAAQVGVLILRTRRQGVVRGAGDEAAGLALDYVPLQADVRQGDRLLTAGIDGIYPRGVPVGTVLSVDAGGQLFHRIRVAPLVDFGSLDQVYLLSHPSVPPQLEKADPGARP
jgi:rod shape-determining protein MreC